MTTRLPHYLMTDHVTLLGAGYFNPIWSDLDRRLVALEGIEQAMSQAIAQLTETGLTRLNTLLLPVISQAQQEIGTLLTETRAEIAALQADFEGIDVEGALDAALEGVALPLLAQPSTAVYGYDDAGRVVSVTEQTPLGERRSTFDYGVEGRILSAAVEQGARRRVETYGYDATGRLIDTSAQEEVVV